MFFPRRPYSSACLDGDVHVLHRQGIFLSDVDIAFVGADGIGADGQPFEDRVGIPFEKAPVHVGAGVPFVRVDDHVLYVAGGIAGPFPLAPRGKAAAAPASQVGFLDFLKTCSGVIRERALASAA